MSRRTAEASKVIAKAWDNEKQLILEGKGTRDWTPDQQQEIIDNGKAYDDNGKAFQGHHMKSVEKYPEYQGEPGNIQFLNRQEHQEAHGGNFQNPTNGYFNPITKITTDFGDNPFVPCNIIELNKPVVIVEAPYVEVQKTENGDKITKDSGLGIKMNSTPKNCAQGKLPAKINVKTAATRTGGIKKVLGSVADFYVKHQDIINPIIEIGGPIIGGLIWNKTRSKGASHNKSAPKVKVSPVNQTINTETVKHVIDRAAPSEHIVPAHRQRYNGVWKEKAPYPRGGKK